MVWPICTGWHQSNLSDAGIQLVFAVGWICLPIDRRICFRLKIIICSVRLSQLNQQLSPSVSFSRQESQFQTHWGQLDVCTRGAQFCKSRNVKSDIFWNCEQLCTNVRCAKNFNLYLNTFAQSHARTNYCGQAELCEMFTVVPSKVFTELRATVPRYICHQVSITANFRIFPPTNCDLLSCGHGDLSPAAAVFVQSSQAICPPQPANGKFTLQILFYARI